MGKKREPMTPAQRRAAVEEGWNHEASKLAGRKIVAARYMTAAEAEGLGWERRPVVLQLDDGTLLYPSMDDEGNGAGALFSNGADAFPVL